MTNEKENTGSPHKHEQTDIDVRYALALAVGMTVTVALLYVVALGVFHHFASSYVSTAASRLSPEDSLKAFPEPRLQVAPRADLEKLRRANRDILESYGWINRDAAIVRIPIERAMDIVAQQGLPDFGKSRKGSEGGPAR